MCDRCASPAELSLDPEADGSADREGAFGIRFTPDLTALTACLQGDLQAAFRDRALPCKRWPVGTAAGLIVVVRDLTESLIWFIGTRIDVPIDWQPIAGERGAMRLVKGPITPAALRVYGARGAPAIIAALLEAPSPDGPPTGHRWRLNDVSRTVSLEMFIACLPVSERQWLWTRAVHWEDAARNRLEAALRAGRTAA